MKLRPYQADAVGAAEAAVAIGMPRFTICLPTGAGKTAVAGELIRRSAGPFLFLAHRVELVEQAARALAAAVGPEAVGIVQGSRRELDRQVVVATQQTAANMAEELPWFATTFVDEAHHTTSDTYRRLLAGLNTEHVVGLTATPLRMDGLRVQDVCGRMVSYASPFDLVEQGYLSDIYDLDLEQDDDEWVAKVCVGLAWGYQRRVLAFACTIGHAEAIHERIAAMGEKSVVIHSGLPAGEPQARLRAFAEHECDILVNVAIVSEGVDVPDISSVIIAKPVESMPWLSQAIGRAMRVAPGKTAGRLYRYSTPVSAWCNPASALSTYRMAWLEQAMAAGNSLRQAMAERYAGNAELREQDRRRLWKRVGYTPLSC